MKFGQFKDISTPELEARILDFWEKNRVFEKLNELVADRPQFVFYEGPPTANGRPGVHHAIARTIKDMICRYKTMRGFRVDRKAGWDTHGLPVEIEIEKQLGLDSKEKIVEYGVAEFNKKCRESVFRYINDWNEITRKLGYWIDLGDAYITLTNDYIESVWNILKNFFDRDLIYKGHKTVAFCPRCETAVSSHEVAQGYQEVADPSVFVKVKAADGDFYYMIWTTTPWTLPSNAAIAMHPEAEYALVEHGGEKLVLAKALLNKVLDGEYKILEVKKGTDFHKRRYVPMFDVFADRKDDAFYVINADFVTLDDGTGIVHVAPGYGADDYVVGQKYGLPVLQAVRADGHFEDFAGKYAGMFMKKADQEIVKDLKISGRLYKKELYTHNYPFCWRCDTPLIYIARHCWYIRTTQFKEQLIKNSNITRWQPDEIRTGRMLDWLENNVDWALSRERFWGTPLPIWECTGCGHLTAVGSIEQLRKEGINVPEGELDLHKPVVDLIKLKCAQCGGEMKRVTEVIDTWFDSGSMPYAQWHYPFENKEKFAQKYPADFISEAIDQTRGWFYSLLAISTMLFDKPAFKNVIVMELVLDKEGKKMSKSRGTAVDPFDIIARHGADPLRWYLLATSNPWVPIRFAEDGLVEVIRKFFDTYKNSYSFFALYANVDDILKRATDAGLTVDKFLEKYSGEPERIDRWIVSRYNTLVKKITARLDNYDITPPARMLTDFVIDDLSNWYIRLNRRRFWAPENDPSKMRAYLTLYNILGGVTRLAAPYIPFLTEFIWRELVPSMDKDVLSSVHLATFPVCDETAIDNDLEEAMATAQKVVSIGRAVRAKKNLKVRQPLAGILVNLPGENRFERIRPELDVIKEELNIKAVEPLENVADVVSYSAKLNFAGAGAKLGKLVKETAAKVAGWDSETIRKFQSSGALTLESAGGSAVLETGDVEIKMVEKEGFGVEEHDGITVALKTELSDDLRDEGYAREMVNKIQNMRKSSGFEVTDRITVEIKTDEPLLSAVKRFEQYICRETLADQIALVSRISPDKNGKNWNINGTMADIAVIK
jgi:isoleucyl-tRNA synthetase